MKYCPNCGSAVEEGARFCGVCGTNLSSGAKPPEPPKKFPVWLGIVIAVLVLGVLGVLFGGKVAALLAPAPAQLTTAVRSVTEPVTEALSLVLTGEAEEIADKKDIGEFSDDITLQVTELPSWFGLEDMLYNSSVLLQVDTEPGDTELGIKLNLSGSDVLSAYLAVDEDGVDFCLPELDGTCYRIPMDVLQDILENELYVDLPEADTLDDIERLTKLPKATVEKLLNKYIDIILSCVNKGNTVKTKGEWDYRAMDGSVDCTLLTFTPDAASLEAMLRTFGETALADEELHTLVRDVMESCGMDTYRMNLALKNMDRAFETLRDDCKEDAEYLLEYNPVFRLGYSGKSLVGFDVLDDDGEGFCYETAPDNGHGYRQDVFCEIFHDEPIVLLKSQLGKKGGSVRGFLELDPGEEYMDAVSVEYDCDTADRSALGLPRGEYEIRWDDEDEILNITVAKNGSGDAIDLHLDDYGDEYGFRISTAGKDSSLRAPKGTPVRLNSPEEIEDVLMDMVDEAEGLFYELLG